jgi:hypothetical protein
LEANNNKDLILLMKKIKDLILEIKVPNLKDPCRLEEIATIGGGARRKCWEGPQQCNFFV